MLPSALGPDARSPRERPGGPPVHNLAHTDGLDSGAFEITFKPYGGGQAAVRVGHLVIRVTEAVPGEGAADISDPCERSR